MTRWKKAGFALVLLVAVLAGAEGLLRLVFPLVRTTTVPDDMVDQHVRSGGFAPDPDLGWTWQTFPARGAQIDEHGFRTSSSVDLDAPGRRAIAFGDSQTYGAGVHPDDTFSAVADAALPGWQVLNRGVSGYRSLNVYRLLQRDVLRFDPDLVIVDCMPHDSPRDDGRTLARGFGLRTLLWNSRLYYALRLLVEKGRPDRSRWLDESGQLSTGQAGNHDLIEQWGRDNGVEVLFMWYPVSTHQFTFDCHTREGELPEGSDQFNACAAILSRSLPHDVRRLFIDRNHLTEEGNRVVGDALAERIEELYGP